MRLRCARCTLQPGRRASRRRLFSPPLSFPKGARVRPLGQLHRRRARVAAGAAARLRAGARQRGARDAPTTRTFACLSLALSRPPRQLFAALRDSEAVGSGGGSAALPAEPDACDASSPPSDVAAWRAAGLAAVARGQIAVVVLAGALIPPLPLAFHEGSKRTNAKAQAARAPAWAPTSPRAALILDCPLGGACLLCSLAACSLCTASPHLRAMQQPLLRRTSRCLC